MKTLSAIIFFSSLLLAGCGRFPRRTTMDDPQVKTLLKAAGAFDRISYGFSSIPVGGDVRIEVRPTGKYDAMLHLSGKTSRTIAFVLRDGKYVWVGEQERFQGPQKYQNEDGTFNEAITLTYETQSVSGYPLNRLNVDYSGKDPRLMGQQHLSLSDVKPILREGGY